MTDRAEDDHSTTEVLPETAPPPDPPDRPRRVAAGTFVAADHLSLIASALGVALIALKLLVVSRGNLTTAQALLQEATVSTVVLGTALTLAGAGVVLVAGICVSGFRDVMRGVGKGDSKPDAAWWWQTGMWISTVLVLLYVSAIIAAALMAIIIRDSFRRRHPRKPESKAPLADRLTNSDRSFLLSMVPFAVMPVLLGSWWPTEAVRVRGADPIAAYVISSNDQTTVLLADSVARRVPTHDIVSRSYCSDQRSKWLAPLFGVAGLTSDSQYPKCPAR